MLANDSPNEGCLISLNKKEVREVKRDYKIKGDSLVPGWVITGGSQIATRTFLWELPAQPLGGPKWGQPLIIRDTTKLTNILASFTHPPDMVREAAVVVGGWKEDPSEGGLTMSHLLLVCSMTIVIPIKTPNGFQGGFILYCSYKDC